MEKQCDGNTPACAACSSVYHTECVYDLNSDHRRKGVYKKDIDNLKTQNGTLQTLVEAILNVFPPLPFHPPHIVVSGQGLTLGAVSRGKGV